MLNFNSQVSNTDFHEIVKEAADVAGLDGIAEFFQSDGDLKSNDWGADQQGEGYANQILETQNARIREAFRRTRNQLAPKVDAVFERYGNGYGVVPESAEEGRRR